MGPTVVAVAAVVVVVRLVELGVDAAVEVADPPPHPATRRRTAATPARWTPRRLTMAGMGISPSCSDLDDAPCLTGVAAASSRRGPQSSRRTLHLGSVSRKRNGELSRSEFSPQPRSWQRFTWLVLWEMAGDGSGGL